MLEVHEYLRAIERDLEAAIPPAVSSPLLEVPTVGWNSLSVLGHMAQNLAHWASVFVARPEFVEDPPPLGSDFSAWLAEFEAWVRRSGEGFIGAVTDALLAGDAPDQRATEGISARARILANEIAVHRWDIENAVGAGCPIEPEAAADYLDLLVSHILPAWILPRRPVKTFEPGIRLQPTDAGAVSCVAIHDGRVVEASEPNVVAVGTSCELLLWTYGRSSDVSIRGSAAAAREWIEICRFN